ncbi:transglycosylase domain-containing protein [Pygmaiobacter massiliensis]|uniref:transglycosylase domain-containing protein n=1 Tax=Pygmaiobacter massiliensis TaxID=1917873 RepID=UPI002A80FD23|nr:transglycosylase domain-containing protein [Pygmaiobacter massiliensis]MDY4784888.1 transglycosylase domain-containing protein [Pygmaiobacter massiliensis]
MRKDHPYREEESQFTAEDNIFDLMDEPDEDAPASEFDDLKHTEAVYQEFEPEEPAPSPKKRKKPKKEKKPHRKRSIWARLATLLLILVLVVGTSLGIYLTASTSNDDLWLDLDQIPYKTETILYAKSEDTGEWEEYSTLPCTQNKIYIPGDQIPDDLRHAFVAVEDQQFYDHKGVNLKRTLFAIFNEAVHAVTGWYPGGVKQGASTIDQQLIKNLTRDDEASGIMGYLRKVKEVYRAYKLDAKYDKEAILAAYLNTISFTDNTAGVEAAALKIFGCHASELTLPQCASLAAITRSPTRYDPEKNPDKHLERRNYVLGEMLEQKYITQEQHDVAVATPLKTTGKGDPERDKTPTDWFTDLVMEEVISDLVDEKGLTRKEASRLIYDGGLRIYTTVVPSLQEAMTRQLAGAKVYPRPAGTVVKALTNEDGTPVLDEEGKSVMGEVTVYPEAGMVSLNYNGEICATAGALGKKETSRSYNRSTMAVRQVGSTMKPIGPYVVALQNNKINWSSAFLDSPVRKIKDEKTGEEKDWPRNFSKTYSDKDLLVADALARSINTIAVRVGERAGVGNIYRFTTRELGISTFLSKDKSSAPMILGASTLGVTPLEMASAYSIFGSGGIYTTPHCYTTAERGDGKVLLKPVIETRQVIDSDTAYIMNRLLRGVMTGAGTAAGYSVGDGMDCIGKTGTTSDDRDHWFIGLTPYYVTSSWYGYDDNLSLSVNYHAHPPTLAWRNVMATAQRGLEHKEFPVDATVVTAEYCTVTGRLAGKNCPHTTGYYKANQLPKAGCPEHD